MNQDTLVLLSGMAPKEPEQWALDEWLVEFKKDYPEPPSASHDWQGKAELLDAVECVHEALNKDGIKKSKESEYWFERESVYLALNWKMNFHLRLSLMRHDRGYVDRFKDGTLAWECWKNECLGEWVRNEWPLLWARKRMQSAEVA